MRFFFIVIDIFLETLLQNRKTHHHKKRYYITALLAAGKYWWCGAVGCSCVLQTGDAWSIFSQPVSGQIFFEKSSDSFKHAKKQKSYNCQFGDGSWLYPACSPLELQCECGAYWNGSHTQEPVDIFLNKKLKSGLILRLYWFRGIQRKSRDI